MYTSEKVFIMKFLAGLKKLGVDEIPYDNTDFYDGVEKMQEYFQRKRNTLGCHTNELSMLFLKHPIGGAFFELREGIARQNGRLMTFENPYYIHATIKLDDIGADFILNQDSLDISNEQILDFSRAFCNGAGLSYNNVEI